MRRALPYRGRPGRAATTRLSCLAAAIVLLLGGTATAQVEVQAGRDSIHVGRIGITGYPYIFYTPETKFAIGGALVLSMALSPDPEVKESNAILSGFYSQTHSYELTFNPEFFFPEDRYYLGVNISFSRFVDKFWGIGGGAPDFDSADYTRQRVWSNVEFDIKAWGPLKLGLNYDYNHTIMVDRGVNPFLTDQPVQGSEGGVTSGAGLVLFADTRNSSYYPTVGGYYKASFLNAGRHLGSTYVFSRIIVDLRQYLLLAEPLVLAVQAYGSGTSGEPPFYSLPAIGGSNTMRGYYEGRYRDKLLAAVQGELRLRLTERWGIVGWAGLGEVAGAMKDFRLKQAIPTVGFGLRFALDPEQLLNIRADFAYGRDSDGIYFNAKEAF